MNLEKSLAHISFLEFLEEKAGELKQFTGQLRKKVDTDSVHLVRVSIKKWKTAIRLLDNLYHIPWKRDFASTGMLFRICGEQRNLEQGIELCYHLDLAEKGIIPFFRQELIKAKRETRTAIKDYDISGVFNYLERVKAFFSTYHPLPRTKTLLKEEDRLLNKAKKLFQQKSRPLHKIRKRLKDLFFLREFTQHAQAKQRKLNKHLDQLGKIQDLVVLEELVKQGNSKGAIPDKVGQKMREKITSKRKRLVKRSEDQLGTFLFPNK